VRITGEGMGRLQLSDREDEIGRAEIHRAPACWVAMAGT
jgi:hypothetical protein